MRRYVPLILLAGCPECRFPGSDCAVGQHLVESACVPDIWDEGEITLPSAVEIDTAADGSLYVRGRLFVVFGGQVTTRGATALVEAAGGTLDGIVPFAGIAYGRFPVVDEASLDAIRRELLADSSVEGVFRDTVNPRAANARDRTDLERLTVAANEWKDYDDATAEPPSLVLPEDFRWAYDRIGLTAAWDAIHDANPVLTPVTVAVLDEPASPSVFASLPLSGANDARLVGTWDPDTRHGTATSAILGAPSDGKGTSGILAGLDCLTYDLAPIAHIGSITDDSSEARKSMLSLSSELLGILMAVRSGARVVNMSYGGQQTDGTMYDRLFEAAPHILWVGSAGNDAADAASHFPAAASLTQAHVVNVAATGRDDGRAVWEPASPEWPAESGSNYDQSGQASVTLAAPGTDVLSTLPGGELTFFGGTSSSAPIVSGVGGLLFAIDPTLTGEEARKILVSTATPLADATISGRMVNAQGAVKAALDGLPEGRKGTGECREPDEAAPTCPGGSGCRWCVTGSFTYGDATEPDWSGAYDIAGEVSVDWQDDATVWALQPTFDALYDGDPVWPITVGCAPDASALAAAQVSTSSIVASGGGVGSWGPHTTEPPPVSGDYTGPTPSPWPSVNCETTSVRLTFAADRVSGTVDMAGEGHTGSATFEGFLKVVDLNDPTSLFCH